MPVPVAALMRRSPSIRHRLCRHTPADLTYGALFAFAGQISCSSPMSAGAGLWLVLPAALGWGAAARSHSGSAPALLPARYVHAAPGFFLANAVVVASLGSLWCDGNSPDSLRHQKPLAAALPERRGGVLANPAFPVALTVVQLSIPAHGGPCRAAIGCCPFLRRPLLACRFEDRKAAALCGIDPGRGLVAAYGVASLIAAFLLGCFRCFLLRQHGFRHGLTSGQGPVHRGHRRAGFAAIRGTGRSRIGLNGDLVERLLTHPLAGLRHIRLSGVVL